MDINNNYPEDWTEAVPGDFGELKKKKDEQKVKCFGM